MKRYFYIAVALFLGGFAHAQQKANYKLAEKFRLIGQRPIANLSTENPAYFYQ